MLADGIADIANVRDEEFGLDRVERLLLENAARPLAEIAEIVLAEAANPFSAIACAKTGFS